MRLLAAATFAALVCSTAMASAAGRDGAAGRIAQDTAVAGSSSANLVARLVVNTLGIIRNDTSSNDGYGAKVGLSNANPSIGIGWGQRKNSAAGLNFFADMGLIAGRPVFVLTPPAGLAFMVNPSDVAAEQQSVQNRANGLRNYPAIKLGIKYTF